MHTRQQYPMGSVSHGTMQSCDLIPTFLDELANRLKYGPSVTRAQRKECFEILNDRHTDDSDFYADHDKADGTLERLFDVLDYFSAPGFYFGSHPGDGADYGYWLSDSFIEGFDGLKVNDTSEVPKGYKGEVLHVNDHGNVTLYTANRNGLKEVWGVI